MKYIDAHAHIHGEQFDNDRSDVINRMKEIGVGCITVGTSLDDSKKAVELAEKYDFVWATIGIHPTDTDEKFSEKDFEDLIKSPKVVAIGECGLDYFHEKNEEKRKIQKENFLKQVEFALKYDKLLMIHCRPSLNTQDAHEDMISILSSLSKIPKGNIHFFTSTEEVANKYFSLGFSVSVPGVVTFARDVAKTIKELPIEKVLVETDCPYATPVPHRGKRNEPIYVIETMRKIAELKGLGIEEVEKIFISNVSRVFNLGLRN